MADGHRRYPVKYLVLHHSVGPEFSNSIDLEVQDWFDRVGKGRGYKNVNRSYHDHPQRNKETFAQAHYALRLYTKDNNPYGWRLTLLMKDPMNNVAWHAGNWPINQQSIGIETCGNYLNKSLPEKALWLIADTFRAHDRSIGGNLQILCHKDISATQCPGRICEQKSLLIEIFNNPYSMIQLQQQLDNANNQITNLRNQVNSLSSELKACQQAKIEYEKQIAELSQPEPIEGPIKTKDEEDKPLATKLGNEIDKLFNVFKKKKKKKLYKDLGK